MRAESAGPDGVTQVFVFDGTAQVMRMINYDKKTYTEMTKADVDRMGAQMAGAMAQMQEQMKNLPPAQRAQMEAMMKGRGMAVGGRGQDRIPENRHGQGRQVDVRQVRGLPEQSEDLGALHGRSQDARIHRRRLPGHAAARRVLPEADAAERGSDVQPRQERRAGIQRRAGPPDLFHRPASRPSAS